LTKFPQIEEKEFELDTPPPDPFHGPKNMPALEEVPTEIMTDVA
jgi:hypothetical protein